VGQGRVQRGQGPVCPPTVPYGRGAVPRPPLMRPSPKSAEDPAVAEDPGYSLLFNLHCPSVCPYACLSGVSLIAGGHRVPSCESNTVTVEAVAVASSMTQIGNYGEDLPGAGRARRLLAGFRSQVYRSLTGRADELFELATPGHPARQPGHRHTPALKSRSRTRPRDHPAAAINPDERSGLGYAVRRQACAAPPRRPGGLPFW
jgi:hypothetical protein